MGINMKFNKWFDDDEGFLDAVAGDPQNEAERVWNASRKAVLDEVLEILERNKLGLCGKLSDGIWGRYVSQKAIQEIKQLVKEEE